MSGSEVVHRHDAQEIRPSHGEPPQVIDIGLPMWEAMEGQQVYAQDIAAYSVVTGSFDPSAAAPQVNNAPAIVVASSDLDATANVYIDAEGLHVLDGAIFITDMGGDSVLNSAGFGGSWIDFLASGFYNGRFAYGTLNAITAATIVNTAETEADYVASMSADLPYWIVESESGAGTLARVADSTASGGFALKWTGTETARVMQDVPIQPGQNYVGYVEWRYTNSASDFNFTMSLQFTDATHDLLGAAVTTTINKATTQSTYTKQGFTNKSGIAPSNAEFLRVMIQSARVSGSPEVWINGVSVEELLRFGDYSFGDADHAAGITIYRGESNPSALTLYDLTNADARFTIESTGEMNWGDGSGAADVTLERLSAGALGLEGAGLYLGLSGGAGLVEVHADTGTYGLKFFEPGNDDFFRFAAIYDGRLSWGDGTAVADTFLGRLEAGVLFVDGVVQQISEISPAQLTANTDNYNPTGGSAAYVWRLSTDASRNLTGIVPNGQGVIGEVHLICNVGSFNLVLVHDATSTTTNRFYCAGGTNVTVLPNGTRMIMYDTTSDRWRVLAG